MMQKACPSRQRIRTDEVGSSVDPPAQPPVANKLEKSVYRMPLPPAYGPPVGKVAEVPRSDKVAYGAYLAGPAGHCIACHSPAGPDGAPDVKNQLGAGGMKFPGPWGVSVSANITPTGLQRYQIMEPLGAGAQGQQLRVTIDGEVLLARVDDVTKYVSFSARGDIVINVRSGHGGIRSVDRKDVAFCFNGEPLWPNFDDIKVYGQSPTEVLQKPALEMLGALVAFFAPRATPNEEWGTCEGATRWP